MSSITLSTPWTLENDSQVLQTIEGLSSSISTSIKKIEQHLDTVSRDVCVCETRAELTLTKLLAVGDGKFLENRVSDVPSPCVEERRAVAGETRDLAQLTKAEAEAVVINNVQAALRSAQTVLSTHFRRVDTRPEDFDELDDPTFSPTPVYEPIDHYAHRPLPAIIGTREFMRDAAREDSQKLRQPQHIPGSDSSAGTSTDGRPVPVSVPPPPAPPLLEPADNSFTKRSDSSGLFGSNDSDDDDFLAAQPSQPRSHFIPPAPPPPPAVSADKPTSSLNQRRKPAAASDGTRPSVDQSAVASQPARPSAIPSITAPSKPSGGGLFLASDSDSDDDLFLRKAPPASTKQQPVSTPRTSSRASSIFSEASAVPVSDSFLRPARPVAQKSIFDTDSEDEGDIIFQTSNSRTAEVVKTEEQPKKTEVKRSSASKTGPTAVSPIKATVNPAATALAKRPAASIKRGGLFDSSSSEEDIFSAPTKPPPPTVVSSSRRSAATIENKKPVMSTPATEQPVITTTGKVAEAFSEASVSVEFEKPTEVTVSAGVTQPEVGDVSVPPVVPEAPEITDTEEPAIAAVAKKSPEIPRKPSAPEVLQKPVALNIDGGGTIEGSTSKPEMKPGTVSALRSQLDTSKILAGLSGAPRSPMISPVGSPREEVPPSSVDPAVSPLASVTPAASPLTDEGPAGSSPTLLSDVRKSRPRPNRRVRGTATPSPAPQKREEENAEGAEQLESQKEAGRAEAPREEQKEAGNAEARREEQEEVVPTKGVEFPPAASTAEPVTLPSEQPSTVDNLADTPASVSQPKTPLFAEAIPENVAIVTPNPAASVSHPMAGGPSVFDDSDSDDDLFASSKSKLKSEVSRSHISEKKSISPPTQKRPPPSLATITASPAPTKPSGLFMSSSDDEALPVRSAEPSASKKQLSKQQSDNPIPTLNPASVSKLLSKGGSKGGLFGDSDEEERKPKSAPIPVRPKVSVPKKPAVPSLFADSDSDDDLFK